MLQNSELLMFPCTDAQKHPSGYFNLPLLVIHRWETCGRLNDRENNRPAASSRVDLTEEPAYLAALAPLLKPLWHTQTEGARKSFDIVLSVFSHEPELSEAWAHVSP